MRREDSGREGAGHGHIRGLRRVTEATIACRRTVPAFPMPLAASVMSQAVEYMTQLASSSQRDRSLGRAAGPDDLRRRKR